MLRRINNSQSGNLSRLAKRKAITVEQLKAVVGLVGWDPAALDAAIVRLRGHRAGDNDNPMRSSN